MSLADALAVSRAARNLVLVGDPRQLAQPLQGSHPPGVGVSALDHLLGGDVTIAPDRGVLLDLTWRMHPDVTAFRLAIVLRGTAGIRAAVRERRRVVIDGVATTGLRASFVEHHGDRVRSDAEAERVRDVIEQLTQRNAGVTRPARASDVARRHRGGRAVQRPGGLSRRERCQPGARVGTVDRFQGQEAAVSIFSMATSSVEDLPRNLEFLFSLNRLNVAVSRARGPLGPGLLARAAPCALPHARADATRQRVVPLRGDGGTVERRAGGRGYAAGMTSDSLSDRLVQSLEAARDAGGGAARVV